MLGWSDFAVPDDATNSTITSNTGNLTIDNASATGLTIVQLGTSTSATAFEVEDAAAANLFTVDGAGDVTVTNNVNVSGHNGTTTGLSLNGTLVTSTAAELNTLDGANATFLRTANNAIGAMPNVSYEKSKHLVGEQTRLYLFSDGVYEVEKSDGSMWQFNEFTDFMKNIKSGSQSKLDSLHQHAENINVQDNFEDDFTILEVAFG